MDGSLLERQLYEACSVRRLLEPQAAGHAGGDVQLVRYEQANALPGVSRRPNPSMTFPDLILSLPAPEASVAPCLSAPPVSLRKIFLSWCAGCLPRAGTACARYAHSRGRDGISGR